MHPNELTHALRKFRNSVYSRGIGGTVRLATERMTKKKSVIGSRLKEHPFDKQYGVKTHGPIDLWKDPEDTSQYDAVAPSLFHEAIRRWQAMLPAECSNISDYTFVDLGAGLGRALLLASQYPFREVMGVELGESLVKIAQQNISHWKSGGHAKCPIGIVAQDALSYQFPAGPLAVFMDNPFGERVTREVVARLRQVVESGGGPVNIIYVYPKQAALLADESKFQHLGKEKIMFDQADREADTFFRDGEICSWYRLVPPPPRK